MERGEIEVKGKGKMHTYFLIKNRTATENEILGRPIRDSDSGPESIPSFQESRTEVIENACQQGRVNTQRMFFLAFYKIQFT